MVVYLIFGNGYFGNKLATYLDAKVSELRVDSYSQVFDEIKNSNSNWVINAIGKTGKPNVDWCETNKEETIFANIIIPLWIAKACQELGVRMMHIGSGCIYNNGVFSEEDEPNFNGNFYSVSKQIAEKHLSEFNVLQLRARMPFDSSSHPRNLINKILSFDKITNVENSITNLDDFCFAAKELMDQNTTGIFNVVNPGIEKHKMIFDIYNENNSSKKNVEVVEQSTLGLRSDRSNCLLKTDKLEKHGIKLRNVDVALRKAIEDIKEK